MKRRLLRLSLLPALLLAWLTTPGLHPILQLSSRALGIIFDRSTNLPADYQRSAFVALHGSWNRSTPDGYKVVSLHWNEDGAITERDLLTGFLTAKGRILSRPAELAQGEDSSLYISDDHGDTLYRLYPTR